MAAIRIFSIREHILISGGMEMAKKDNRKNAQNVQNTSQPEPMSGSHKVKNRQHSRQKHNSHHDM